MYQSKEKERAIERGATGGLSSEGREVGATPTTSSPKVDDGRRDEETDRETDGDLDKLDGDVEARGVGVGVAAAALRGELEETAIGETRWKLKEDADDLAEESLLSVTGEKRSHTADKGTPTITTKADPRVNLA